MANPTPISRLRNGRPEVGTRALLRGLHARAAGGWTPPPTGQAEWRYRAFLLPHWAELGTLPLYGVSLSQRLGEIEDLGGSVPKSAPHPEIVRGRTALVVERDRELWWAGMIWRFDWSSDAPNRQLSAKSWESMLQKRSIIQDLTYAGVDQLEIARALVQHAQQRPGGELWIDTPSFGAATQARDRTYTALSRKPIWEALQELAAVQGGFEQRLRPYWSGEQVRWTYELGYPELGRGAQQTGMVLDYQQGWPGSSIMDYSWPDDASGYANVAHVLGDQIVGTREDAAAWDYYPRLERTWSHTSVKEQSTIDAHAQSYLEAYSTEQPDPQLELRTDRAHRMPEPGDWVRLRLTSDRHPARAGHRVGLDETWRVVERQITAPSRGAIERCSVRLQRGQLVETAPELLRTRRVATWG